MSHNSTTAKKLTASVITIIALSFCLVVTTYALVRVSVGVDYNWFHTGTVEINLNNGKPIIDATDPAEEFKLFEPGMTVKKDFFVENLSTDSIYYSVYLDDVKGDLADILEIAIKEGDTVLCSGTARELNQHGVGTAGKLEIGQRRNLTAWFYYPKEAGNGTQELSLTFTLCAKAVQTRNNPGGTFD